MKRVSIRIAGLFPALCLLLTAGAVSQESEESSAYLVALGRTTFTSYCANCHGQEGKGNGHLAQYLTVQPKDLTRIAARNDGTFDEERVSAFIDGRKKVRGHGTSEMPIWGDAFSTVRPEDRDKYPDPEMRVEKKIEELVAYLKSIQEE